MPVAPEALCILGIETSCDDTGIAIYKEKVGLLAHSLHSQTTTHLPYGGVVPELASRDHIQHLCPLIQQTLANAECPMSKITGIAYTAGPGLSGALLVGATFAKSLAYALHIPSLGIHHMEGHLLAPMLESNPPDFPFLALLVSGGHTLLVQVEKIGHYTLLGESLDDAAGEAFDKIAKLLGLPMPGGPALSTLATQGSLDRFHFPRPLTEKPGLNFSFSGLKTSTTQALRNTTGSAQDKADIACAFQEAVVDTLLIKCQRALQTTGLQRLVIAGGVSANQRLREKFSTFAQTNNIEIYYPRPEFCTDNGAMIAYAGYQRFKMGFKEGLEISVFPRWSLMNIE